MVDVLSVLLRTDTKTSKQRRQKPQKDFFETQSLTGRAGMSKLVD
jgi:hypothetical protein